MHACFVKSENADVSYLQCTLQAAKFVIWCNNMQYGWKKPKHVDCWLWLCARVTRQSDIHSSKLYTNGNNDIHTHTRCQQVDNYSTETWTTFTVTVTIKQTTQMPFIRRRFVELLWSRYTGIMQCKGGKTSSDWLLGGVVSEWITAADLKSGWWLGIDISVQLFWTWLRVISGMLRSFINLLLHLVINSLCHTSK